MKTIIVTLILVSSFVSANAFASCTQGGRTYADGDKVGPFVCDNGRWIRR